MNENGWGKKGVDVSGGLTLDTLEQALELWRSENRFNGMRPTLKMAKQVVEIVRGEIQGDVSTKVYHASMNWIEVGVIGGGYGMHVWVWGDGKWAGR